MSLEVKVPDHDANGPGMIYIYSMTASLGVYMGIWASLRIYIDSLELACLRNKK